MKYWFIILPTFLLLVLGSCKTLDDLLTFTISDTATLTIENGGLNLPVELQTPDVTTNSSQEFSNHDTRADLVKDVKLTQLQMEIVSPEGKTFSFLKSMKVYISTDGSDKVLLAYHDNIPSTATSVALTTTDEKLDKYLKGDSYQLHTSFVTRETLSQPVDLQFNLEFKVTADPL